MPDEKIQLVCFDLGRVLIRLCDGWAHAARLAGVTRVPLDLHELDASTRAIWDQIAEEYEAGKIDQKTFAMKGAAHRRIEADDVLRLQMMFLQGAYAGATELINQLCDAGVAVACLSNTAEPHWGQVHDPKDPNYLPMDRLTYKFASHLIGFCKPHEKIYEHVERTSGLRPREIMFFDDLEANVLGAQKRGWRAIQVRDFSDPIREIRVYLKEHRVPIN